MELLIGGIIAILIGGFRLYYNYQIYKNPEELKRYVEKSHKAWIWKKAFGVEKTEQLTKNIFLPAGTVLAILMVLGGFGLIGWSLIMGNSSVDVNVGELETIITQRDKAMDEIDAAFSIEDNQQNQTVALENYIMKQKEVQTAMEKLCQDPKVAKQFTDQCTNIPLRVDCINRHKTVYEQLIKYKTTDLTKEECQLVLKNMGELNAQMTPCIQVNKVYNLTTTVELISGYCETLE